MSAFLEAMRDCRGVGRLCVLIGLHGTAGGLLGVVLGAVGVRGPARLLGVVAIAMGVLAVGTGAVGRVLGESKVESVLAGNAIDLGQKARIRAMGIEEAGQCVAIVGWAAVLPFLLGAVALGIGLAIEKKTAS